ncbi:hypothetical protein HFO39_14150 [Rhizobium leguminosarum]|uniref:hypothetical protein n=1 Tax=Rhizobium leguminosarum TaxID=384 RepID=UPI001C97CC2B|nr:hypothetical protein [Rhizobium leguminosarum]MBY5635911.1 hypothetical protein [Rhizobium leguminosarum]
MKYSLIASLTMFCLPVVGQPLCAEVNAFILFECTATSQFRYIAVDTSLLPFVGDLDQNYLMVFQLDPRRLHPQFEPLIVEVKKGEDGIYKTQRDLLNDDFTISKESITHVIRKFEPIGGQSIVSSEGCYRK